MTLLGLKIFIIESKKMIKNLVKHVPIVNNWYRKINNLNERRDFVKHEVSSLSKGSSILDAGCGSQQFKHFCSHLNYKAQDFGKYTIDDKKMIGGGVGIGEGKNKYKYGKLDYVGDIWEIDEKDQVFDAILCTEVFEHIAYPIETVKEFSRLLKKDGRLILTAPSNCLRHMDPYFFYSGFSDRWYEKFLSEYGFEILSIEPVGDYYSWLGVEMIRTARSNSFFAKLILLPAFVYYFSKKPTKKSIDTLCMGYHVVARKV